MTPILLSIATTPDPAGTFRGSSDNIFSSVLVLVVMAAVIAAAYFTTRWIAGGAVRMQKGSRMRVVDRLPLARDRYVAVVEVGGRYYMLGVSGSQITMLGEVDGAGYGAADAPPPSASWRAALFEKMNAPAPQDAQPVRSAQAQEPPSPERVRSAQEDELARLAERIRRRNEILRREPRKEDGDEA